MVGGLVFRRGQPTNVTTRLKGARTHKAQVNRGREAIGSPPLPISPRQKADDCNTREGLANLSIVGKPSVTLCDAFSPRENANHRPILSSTKVPRSTDVFPLILILLDARKFTIECGLSISRGKQRNWPYPPHGGWGGDQESETGLIAFDDSLRRDEGDGPWVPRQVRDG